MSRKDQTETVFCITCSLPEAQWKKKNSRIKEAATKATFKIMFHEMHTSEPIHWGIDQEGAESGTVKAIGQEKKKRRVKLKRCWQLVPQLPH